MALGYLSGTGDRGPLSCLELRTVLGRCPFPSFLKPSECLPVVGANVCYLTDNSMLNMDKETELSTAFMGSKLVTELSKLISRGF